MTEPTTPGSHPFAAPVPPQPTEVAPAAAEHRPPSRRGAVRMGAAAVGLLAVGVAVGVVVGQATADTASADTGSPGAGTSTTQVGPDGTEGGHQFGTPPGRARGEGPGSTDDGPTDDGPTNGGTTDGTTENPDPTT